MQTTSTSKEFSSLLELVAAAAQAEVPLIQIREKQLSTRVLLELASQAAGLLRASTTRLLINDRADVALASGASGVHLTTGSLDAALVRRTFGEDFLIGVSTHSITEARNARDAGADFAVFGPVFETTSKQIYGEAVGLEKLDQAARELAPFPLLALGGVALDKLRGCASSGAAGIAAIGLLENPEILVEVVATIRRRFQNVR